MKLVDFCYSLNIVASSTNIITWNGTVDNYTELIIIKNLNLCIFSRLLVRNDFRSDRKRKRLKYILNRK